MVPPGFLMDVSRKALEVCVYACTHVHAKQAGKTLSHPRNIPLVRTEELKIKEF